METAINSGLVLHQGRGINLPPQAKPVNRWVGALIGGVVSLIGMGTQAYSSSREDQISSQQQAQAEFDQFIAAVEQSQQNTIGSTTGEKSTSRIWLYIAGFVILAVIAYFLFIHKKKRK